jgi:hypothetical protein
MQADQMLNLSTHFLLLAATSVFSRSLPAEAFLANEEKAESTSPALLTTYNSMKSTNSHYELKYNP